MKDIDYKKKIQLLTSEILNKKKEYKDISSWEEFYSVQRILYKMGRMELVKEMGLYAGEYLDKTFGKKRGEFGRMSDMEYKDSGIKLTKWNGYVVGDVVKFSEFVGRQKKFKERLEA